MNEILVEYKLHKGKTELIFMHHVSPVPREDAQWTFTKLIIGNRSTILELAIDMAQFPVNKNM